jgi:hypothetical protein
MKMLFFEVLSWLVGLVLENWVDGIDMHLQNKPCLKDRAYNINKQLKT